MAVEACDSFISELCRKRKIVEDGSSTVGRLNSSGGKNDSKAQEQSLKDKDIEIKMLKKELKENEALLESANSNIFTTQLVKENLLGVIQNQAKEINNLKKQNQKLLEENNQLKVRSDHEAQAEEAFHTAEILRMLSDSPPPEYLDPETQSELEENQILSSKLLPKPAKDNFENKVQRKKTDIEDMEFVLDMDDNEEEDSVLSFIPSPLWVECPLCSFHFLIKEQEQHAASCQGVEQLLLQELHRQEGVQEIAPGQEQEETQDIIEILEQEEGPDIELVQEEEQMQENEDVQEILEIQENDLGETTEEELEEVMSVQPQRARKSLKRVSFSLEALERAGSPGRRSREELHLLARRDSVRKTGF